MGLYAYSGHYLDLSGSSVGYFLVVVHWNRASISKRFRDIWL